MSLANTFLILNKNTRRKLIMIKTIKKSVLGLSLIIGAALPAYADMITFDIQWSGETFNNSASSTGYLTIDSTICAPEVAECNIIGSGITDFGVTVSGASDGNGSFSFGDFSNVFFSLIISELDFNIELIGQELSNGCLFGTSTGSCGGGTSGDFNAFNPGGASTAPAGSFYFVLRTYGNEEMLVTSMLNRDSVSVSSPAGVMLLGMGLLAIGFARKSKKA
jgi:hypothetical protein